jgi:hypothetical protein
MQDSGIASKPCESYSNTISFDFRCMPNVYLLICSYIDNESVTTIIMSMIQDKNISMITFWLQYITTLEYDILYECIERNDFNTFLTIIERKSITGIDYAYLMIKTIEVIGHEVLNRIYVSLSDVDNDTRSINCIRVLQDYQISSIFLEYFYHIFPIEYTMEFLIEYLYKYDDYGSLALLYSLNRRLVRDNIMGAYQYARISNKILSYISTNMSLK